MATSTRLILQPHLRRRLEAVSSLLEGELRTDVEAVLAQPELPELAEVEASRASASLVEEAAIVPEKESHSHSSVTESVAGRTEAPSEKASNVEKEKTEGKEVEEEGPEVVPPTVDVDLLDRLSRWISGREATLRKADLGELFRAAPS